MRKILILTYLFLFFGAGPVFAIDSPTLLNPSNNSTVTSSTLNWQTPAYQLYSSNPYRVQVDDDPGFSPSNSIYRDTYKNNTTYTPQLTGGTWYWRVKAKDASGTWSNWSDIWSFTLGSSNPTPTPSDAPSPSSTPAPTSVPSSSSSSTSSLFNTSGPPSQINSDSSFTVSVNLSLSNNPNTAFFLKGAFKKSDSSNYFGLTKVSGEWIKNSSTHINQYKITTDSSGNWSGNLEIKPDCEDSGFTGSGDYIFKVARYNSSGSGPIWSNDSNINIVQTQSNTNQGTTNQQLSADASLTSTSQSDITSPTLPPKTNLTKTTPAPKFNYQTASVAGATASATPSLKTSVKNQKQINPFVFIGVVFIIGGVGSLGYNFLHKNEAVYKYFRRKN